MRYQYGLGAALVACALPAAAQKALDPVVVTANRTPTTASETLGSVDVITREAVEARQPLDVPDLLGGLAGIDISRNGGRGNTASISIRGTSNDQTLLLIDGVRVGSATTGGPALQNLAPEQIERIEVVRGPRASLYGADAIGGVIQIFTRKNQGAEVSVTAGGHDTKAVNAGYGRSGEKGYWSINAARHLTDGFDVIEDDGKPDDDGFRQTSFSFRGAREVTDKARVTAAIQYREGDVRSDGSVDGSSKKQHSSSLGLELSPTDFWDLSLDLTRAFDDLDARDFGGDRFTTERHQISLQNDFYLGTNQVLTLGGDFRRDEVESNVRFDEDDRDNAAVFGQYQWRPGDWDFEVSLRHDDNEAFGNETTGSVAAGYQFTETVRGFASYGTGFKAPSFNDLFFPDVGFFRGNPNLDPERSESWEVGLQGEGHVQWRLAGFYTEIEDLIVNEPTSAGSFVFVPQNVREAEIPGIEASVETRIANLRTRANATWVDPENQDGAQLPRRSKVSANLEVSRALGDCRLGASARYRGDRYNSIDNDVELDGFTTVDLRASWQFAPQWQLRSILRNATDEDYATAQSVSGNEFNAPGRQALITLSWNQGNK